MNVSQVQWSILIVCLAAGTAAAQADKSFSLKTQTQVAGVKPIDPDYYQEPIIGANQEPAGVILIAKQDRKIQFALLNENGKPRWRRDAPSTWAVVSADGSRIALVGQDHPSREGYAGSEFTVFAGVEVLDARGNAVFSIPKTKPVTHLSLAANGDLFVSEGGNQLSYYDRSGHKRWTVKQRVHEASFAGSEKYIKTFSWNGKTDLFTLTLLDVRTGKQAKKITYERKYEKRILEVDPQNDTVLMAEFVIERETTDCRLAVYDLKTWTEQRALENLSAGPFSVAHNQRENGFCFLTLERKKGVTMTFWDLDDGSVARQTLGIGKSNFGTDRITCHPQDNTYSVYIGRQLLIYDHLK